MIKGRGLVDLVVDCEASLKVVWCWINVLGLDHPVCPALGIKSLQMKWSF